MSLPYNESPHNEMTHPIPHLQPNTNTQCQAQNEDNHAEKKRKAHALTKSSLISLEGNQQSNVKFYL